MEKIGINFRSLLDGELAPFIDVYSSRSLLITLVDQRLRECNWIEFNNGVTFEKTFVPSSNEYNTVVNNNERIFIVTDGNQTTVCNLADLPKVWRDRAGIYTKVYHIWNGNQVPASKKMINDMFEAAKINFVWK